MTSPVPPQVPSSQRNPFLAALSELGAEPDSRPSDGSARPVQRAARTRIPTGPVIASSPSTVEALLSSLGLPSADEHEQVCLATEKVLVERGHQAEVRSYRFGCVVVTGSPVAVRRLQHDIEQVEACLAACLGTESAPRVLVRAQRRSGPASRS